MMGRPDLEAASQHILTILHDSPVGASTRFSLADALLDRYPALERDEARSLVARALAALQEARTVVVLRPESWDLSGDERVRLVGIVAARAHQKYPSCFFFSMLAAWS